MIISKEGGDNGHYTPSSAYVCRNWFAAGFSLAVGWFANYFNVNSPRGVVFSTSGTGFQVSGNAGVTPVRFDNINVSYSSIFQTFSQQRLFTALSSNVLDVNIFVPGSNTPATVSGFGAV